MDLDVYVEPMPLPVEASAKMPSKRPTLKVEESDPTLKDLAHTSKPKSKRERSDRGGSKGGGGTQGQSIEAASAPASADDTVPQQLDETGEEELIEGGEMNESGITVKNRSIRVKVGTAPLVIREGEDLNSPIIGQLHSGQMVTVIRETVSAGKVRAMVALQSISRLPEAPTGKLLAMRDASTDSLYGGSNRASPTGSPTAAQSSQPMFESAVATSSTLDNAPIGYEQFGVEMSHEEISATVATQGVDALAGSIGWVTLVKGGKKLVTSRVRQSAGSRQQHQQQWTRRMANEKQSQRSLVAASGGGEKVNKDAAVKKIVEGVSLEISSDPTGIGFAFGGIHPGTLHARGNLFEAHNVSYSIGLVGQYLLHVRLRQQAAALPGSPFCLTVKPGKAHALSTTLPRSSIAGTVGMGAEMGCGLTLYTADIMGNACIEGGADVTGECVGSSAHVETTVVDNGDGTYSIHWNSNMSGTFSAAIKIFDQHVVGSPATFKLKSTTPDFSKSELSGSGLSSAVAGIPNHFRVKFFDQFTNSALPGSMSNFGLALLKSGEKNKEAKVHEHTIQLVDEETGEYEFTYTAAKDGTFDLHVWSEDLATGKSERIPFPNSPFHCIVAAGPASPQKSYVEGFTKESRAVDKHGKALQQETNSIIAGDAVVIKPQICDDLGNAAALPEGSLDVNIVFPDGTSHDLGTSSLKFTMQSKGGITVYDIRHDAIHAGEHEMHVSLHGKPITGSPVVFRIETANAEVKMCKLTPPAEPTLYSSSTYAIILKTFDRFGNPMIIGGLPVSARLQLIKSGVHDLTTLMPNNNTVDIVDNHDGTYCVNVSLIKIAASVKVSPSRTFRVILRDTPWLCYATHDPLHLCISGHCQHGQEHSRSGW